jgi:hypothetical protein
MEIDLLNYLYTCYKYHCLDILTPSITEYVPFIIQIHEFKFLLIAAKS